MESKYDKVVIPDNAYLATSDQEDFGTGVYSVSYRDYRRENTFKLACFRIHKRRKRTIFLGCGVILLLIIFVVGLVVAVSKKGGGDGESAKGPMKDKPIGLDFYPKPNDGSNVIKFSLEKSSYKELLNNMEFHVNDYSLTRQSGKQYDRCNNNTRPEGKQCQFKMSHFETCSHYSSYGYDEQSPCVLLVLRPPIGLTPVPFEKDNEEVNKYFQEKWSPNLNETFATRWAPFHVPVSCRGMTEKDVHYLGKSESYLKFKPIEYFPENGYPLKYFPAVSDKKYIYPAVMVKFNTLMANRKVSVNCTAWAKNFNNGHPESSTEYTASFDLLQY